MDKLDAYAKIKFLINELNKHTELYDAGKPTISDKEWDDMYFELQNLERDWGYVLADSPTQRVSYTIVNELSKVRHNHPMLSLDKTKDWDTFVQYFGNHDVVGMLKMDGLTCSLRYIDGKLVGAETRGNGEIGEDIFHNALVIPSIPKKINYKDELVIDGEIICTAQDFEAFKDEYANSRNFAAGSIRLLDSQECAQRKLQFVAWNVIVGPYNTVIDNFTALDTLGFTVVPWVSSWGLGAKEFLVKQAADYGYPIDGLVGRFNDISYGESLGLTGHHSRAAYAFKFYDELYATKLIDIEWTMGKTNVLTPTAIFQTVNIDSTDVSKASLHNISIIKKLGLTNNCTVQVYKANQIIPQIDSCLPDGNSAIVIPERCPICNGVTAIQQDNESEVLICTNLNCSGKLLGKLNAFVSRNCMDIRGLSESTLEKFINLGYVNNFKDIYYLSNYYNELIELDGFGKKSIDKLLQAIEKSRDVKLENFIAALGIDGIGLAAAKTISNYFGGDYDRFIQAYKECFDWTWLDDFGVVMYYNLEKYLDDNLEMIYELAAEMRFVKRECKEENDKSLDGLKFCITGSFSQSRDKLKELLEAKGAKSVSSVSKNLDVLFCGEKAGSKLNKAQSLGVRIAYEDELMKMLEG